MRNKKMICSLTSVFLAVLMIVLSTTISADSYDAVENLEPLDKISDSLKNEMSKMGDDDKVVVSVWFSDIDYSKVKKDVENSLVNRNSNHQHAIDLVFLNELKNNNDTNDTQKSLSELTEEYDSVLIEDVQRVIEEKRTVTSELYQSYNKLMLDEILDKDIVSTILLNENNIDCKSSEIVYISRYAPNVELMLTRDEILKVAENSSVEEINYVNVGEFGNAIETRDWNFSEDDEPYDMTFFDVTGLSTARDVWGLNGANMKVGMVEYNGHPDTAISDLANITKVYSPETVASRHASLVASVMVGKTIDQYGRLMFEGAIPSASLYSASIDGEDDIKSAVEALLDEGVTAINASLSYPESDLFGFNEYGDIAKWYDHVSAQHNVHIVLSSGNTGSLGVKRTNTSYNAIVVGACDNDGTIHNTSSYTSISNFMNKPDIVAPGEVAAPIFGSSGTSFAAPMVTSAVIQMSQANSVLMANPTLMKAVLLGSAKITSSMAVDTNVYSEVNESTSAISQVYGAGMLNVTKAYTSVIDDLYYKTGTMSPYTYTANYQKNITKVRGKTLRFCLTWNKMNIVNDEHISGTLEDNILDNFKLTVTTPSGDVYTSQNLYDNKQMISFVATENGYYSFKVDRVGTENSGEIVRYSIAYSKQ